MIGIITCSTCGDTWCRDMLNIEMQSYIRQHPELEKQILAGEIAEVDLGEVLCDGCEDYYRDEAELAAAWQEHYEHLDDTDGTHKSWLCGNCGDPAYDCGCDGDEILDIEDEIDRKAELIKNGRLR